MTATGSVSSLINLIRSNTIILDVEHLYVEYRHSGMRTWNVKCRGAGPACAERDVSSLSRDGDGLAGHKLSL